MRNIFKTLILICAFLVGLNTTYAQDTQDEDAELTAGIEEAPDYIYEDPTPDKLALLYWALNRLDINNKDHINNFMLITECDIYRNYFSDEFEWKGIVEAAKLQIEKNKKNFPLRFAFMQPLKLGEYDIKRQRFNILDEYKINGARRFEVLSSNYLEEICDLRRNAYIPGYPRGLIVELSRPVNLTYLPVEEKIANEFIKSRINENPNLKRASADPYQNRDVYMLMKIKVFAYKGEERVSTGQILAQVLAVLEGYEVYADIEKKELLFSKYFRKKKKKKTSTGDQNGKIEIPGHAETPALTTAPSPTAMPIKPKTVPATTP